MNLTRCITLLALLAAGGLPGQLWAQSPSPVLHGRILDATRAPVPGAQVKAVRDGSNTSADVTSNQNGDFSLALQPGKYALRISKEGFADASQTVDLTAHGLDIPEITLTVAPAKAIVTVTENAGYLAPSTRSATKTLTPLSDVPQSVSVVTREQIKDQMLLSIGDVVNYVPGVTAIQGENNRDQLVIRGNSTSADFFLNGVRDDVQYYRDLYNLDRVEVLKGPNALIFGRGGAGGVVNRVTKEAGDTPLREITLDGGSFGTKRIAMDFDQPLIDKVAFRANGVYENSGTFRDYVNVERWGINPTMTFRPDQNTRVTVATIADQIAAFLLFRISLSMSRPAPSLAIPISTPSAPWSISESSPLNGKSAP